MGEPQEMFTPLQVWKHRSEDDCWLVIHGKVYDVTKFLDAHPGGRTIMKAVMGGDATYSFELWKHGGDARRIMKNYCIGKFCENPGENAKSAYG